MLKAQDQFDRAERQFLDQESFRLSIRRQREYFCHPRASDRDIAGSDVRANSADIRFVKHVA